MNGSPFDLYNFAAVADGSEITTIEGFVRMSLWRNFDSHENHALQCGKVQRQCWSLRGLQPAYLMPTNRVRWNYR